MLFWKPGQFVYSAGSECYISVCVLVLGCHPEFLSQMSRPSSLPLCLLSLCTSTQPTWGFVSTIVSGPPLPATQDSTGRKRCVREPWGFHSRPHLRQFSSVFGNIFIFQFTWLFTPWKYRSLYVFYIWRCRNIVISLVHINTCVALHLFPRINF